MNRLRISAFTVILLTASSVAHALPISYQESVSGDLHYSGTTTFALDFGDNTISGTTSWLANTGFDAEADAFRFTLPAGSLLTSINFAFATTGTATTAELGYTLLDLTPLSTLGSAHFSVLGTGSVAFLPGLLPLAPDTYFVSSGFDFVKESGLESGFSTDYTWTLRVASASASVPDVASTFGLLGFACAGLATASRWRRT